MISRPTRFRQIEPVSSSGMGWDPFGALGSTRLITTECEVGGIFFADLDAIVIDSELGFAESRSVLAHEIAHRELGHWPAKTQVDADRLEHRAQRWAAIRLITIEDLAAALRADCTIWEVAEELGVDPELLEVRLRWLDEAERRELGCLDSDLH